MECNPESADNAYFCGLKAAGVNRISFGVQSLDDGELAALGRLHNADKAREAVLSAYSAGFINISADLMIATPMQTAESLDRTLDSLLRLPLTHVSAYLLKVEKGTPLSFDQTIAEKLPNEEDRKSVV